MPVDTCLAASPWPSTPYYLLMSCPAPPKIAGDEIKNVDHTHAHRLALLLLVSGLDWYCISATHILTSLISFFSPHISLPFSLHKHTHASCPYFRTPSQHTHYNFILDLDTHIHIYLHTWPVGCLADVLHWRWIGVGYLVTNEKTNEDVFLAVRVTWSGL
ncbi:hypothetical protein FB451DRAFT_1289035 [Mycena latifolia]|nr:hypothetical protein FB451DRAFT_1289035 [Mycena latifolia]